MTCPAIHDGVLKKNHHACPAVQQEKPAGCHNH